MTEEEYLAKAKAYYATLPRGWCRWCGFPIHPQERPFTWWLRRWHAVCWLQSRKEKAGISPVLNLDPDKDFVGGRPRMKLQGEEPC